MPVLRLQDVHLDYPGRPGVLRGVTLQVAAGELVVLRGRSGSGKSSLLGVCAGLQVPTSGTAHVAGEDLAGDASHRAHVRARHVGLVLQHLHLLGELSLQDNVALPMHLAGWRRPATRERSQALLARFGLAALAKRLPGQCSGGEQQRAAIARALALKPALLLVDEPTSNLDARNALGVAKALEAARSDGAAVLVASHDDVLDGFGRHVHLVDGRLEARA